MKKRRPERLRPGLKQQTPVEAARTTKAIQSDRERWAYLFHPDRNRWVLIR